MNQILWVVQKHTCDECISVEGLKLIEFTAIYDSGNDLQLASKKNLNNMDADVFRGAALICFRTE